MELCFIFFGVCVCVCLFVCLFLCFCLLLFAFFVCVGVLALVVYMFCFVWLCFVCFCFVLCACWRGFVCCFCFVFFVLFCSSQSFCLFVGLCVCVFLLCVPAILVFRGLNVGWKCLLNFCCWFLFFVLVSSLFVSRCALCCFCLLSLLFRNAQYDLLIMLLLFPGSSLHVFSLEFGYCAFWHLSKKLSPENGESQTNKNMQKGH